MIINLLSVFLLGMLELWVAIPVGFALKMNPLLIGGVTILGSIWSVLVVVVIGEKAVSIIMKISGKKNLKKTGKTYQLWEKYGIPGLGLISPLLMGAPLGTAIGITLGADIFKIIFWMCIGIIFWSTVLTSALWLGIINVYSLF